MQGFQKVVSTDDLSLFLRYTSNDCNIRITEKQGSSIYYEATVTKLSDKLKNFCQNGLSDLKQILKEKNFLVEKEERKRIIRVMLPNPISKVNMEYDKFILQEKFDIDSNIQQILNFCNSEKDLSQSQIKQFFEVLALEVQGLKSSLRINQIAGKESVEKSTEDMVKAAQNVFEERGKWFQNAKKQIQKIYHQLKEGVVEEKIVKVGERVEEIEKRMQKERLYQKSLAMSQQIKKLKAKVDGIIKEAHPNHAQELFSAQKFSLPLKSKTIQQQLKQFENDCFLNSFPQSKKKIDQFIKISKQKNASALSNSILQSNQGFSSLHQYQKAKTEIQQIEKNKGWVDSESFGCQKGLIVLKGNKIFAKNWVDIFGTPTIAQKPRFKVKIIKMGKYMVIGIVDEKLKYDIKSSKTKNQIYYNSGSIVWNGVQKEEKKGPGFKQGDQITVQVDIQQGQIRWRNQQELIYGLSSQKIKDSSINWVPFVYLHNNGDIIEAQ